MLHICASMLNTRHKKVYTEDFPCSSKVLELTKYSPIYWYTGKYDGLCHLGWGIDPSNKRVIISALLWDSRQGGWAEVTGVAKHWYDDSTGNIHCTSSLTTKCLSNRPNYLQYHGGHDLICCPKDRSFFQCYSYNEGNSGGYQVFNSSYMWDNDYLAKYYDMTELTNSSNWILHQSSTASESPMNFYHPNIIKGGMPLSKSQVDWVYSQFKGKKFMAWLNITPAQSSGFTHLLDGQSIWFGNNKRAQYRNSFSPQSSLGSFIFMDIRAFHHDINGQGFFDILIFEREAFLKGKIVNNF